MTDEIVVTGFIVSTMQIGEYDKRVVLVTGELGKIHAFVRGARRINNRFLAQTEPLSFGEFRLVAGRTAYSIVEIKTINYFSKLKTSIDMVYYGYYFLELASYFARENLPDRELIKLLYISFVALETEKKEFSPKFVKAIFEIKLLSIEGLLPSVDSEFFEKKNLEKTLLYTINFITNTRTEKVFTFDLEENIKKKFVILAENIIRVGTDAKFNSLELLK